MKLERRILSRHFWQGYLSLFYALRGSVDCSLTILSRLVEGH
jgi:hypothetical protein